MPGSSRRARTFTLGHLGAVAGALLVAGCEQGQLAGATAAGGDQALTVDHVVPTGQVCAPTGKHANHQAFACATCHQCAGTLSFDAAVAGPNAAFDATAKTCSSVACHAVASGTFTYSTWDWGSDSSVNVSVPYGGTAGTGQASWYAAGGSTCDACHAYPPAYNGTRYTWHSGMHGVTLPDGNTCQLCHPDVTGAFVAAGYAATSGGLIATCTSGFCSAPGTITVPSQHANGTLDVAPRWASRCMGCH